jgi:hypothetical protein
MGAFDPLITYEKGSFIGESPDEVMIQVGGSNDS